MSTEEKTQGNEEAFIELHNIETEIYHKKVDREEKKFENLKVYLINEAKKYLEFTKREIEIFNIEMKNKHELLTEENNDYKNIVSYLQKQVSLSYPDSHSDSNSDSILDDSGSLLDDSDSFSDDSDSSCEDPSTGESDFDRGLKDSIGKRKIEIYKIKKKEKESEPKNNDSSNYLILHGSQGYNVPNIISNGFRPSATGSVGPGIYLTTNVNSASNYGYSLINDSNEIKLKTFIFANRVKNIIKTNKSKKRRVESSKNFARKPYRYSNGRKLEDYIPNDKDIEDYSKLYENPKVFNFPPNENEEVTLQLTSRDRYDSYENKVFQGTFNGLRSEEKMVLAHQNDVSPEYLITYEHKLSLNQKVFFLLYNVFDLPNFLDEHNSDSESSSDSSSDTLESFMVLFKKEIDFNQKTKRKVMELQFQNFISTLERQISVNLSDLSEIIFDDEWYLKELIKDSNDFILISSFFFDKKDSFNPEVVKVFQYTKKREFCMVDRNLKDMCITGVKSYEIVDFITKMNFKKDALNDMNLFDKKPKQKTFSHNLNLLFKNSSNFEKQIENSSSYVKIDESVKKLSFILILRDSGLTSYENSDSNEEKFSTMEKFDGFFRKPSFNRFEDEGEPLYLVVFKQ